MRKMTDEKVLKKFKEEKPWGLYTSVDLYGCDPQIIRSAEKIKQFAVELCDLIKMKRYGEPVVVNFGQDPRITGYSMTQLIETSLISGHFANQSNAAYIDIFSCKKYPPQKLAEFCKKFFKAKEVKTFTVFRY